MGDGGAVREGAWLSPSSFADLRWQIRGVADFDVDGHPDLLWQQQQTGELYVWYMSGLAVARGGRTTPPVVPPVWQIRALADLDGDGSPDLLWHNQQTGELFAWFLERGVAARASYLTPARIPPGDWLLAQAADFDRDGHTDLLWRQSRTGDLYVWFMDGLAAARGGWLTPGRMPDPNWAIVPR
jgi:hypothetical protein